MIIPEKTGMDDYAYHTILTVLVKTGEQSSTIGLITSMRSSEFSSTENSNFSVQKAVEQSVNDQLAEDSVNHEILITLSKLQLIVKQCSSQPFNEVLTLSLTLENAMSALWDIRSYNS